MSSEFFLLPTDGQRPLYDTWHRLCLDAVAGASHRRHKLLPLLAIRGQYLGYPLGGIVANVAQVARHAEDEVVSATDVRTAPHLLFQHLDNVFVGDVFVGLWVVFWGTQRRRDTEVIYF